MLKSTFRILAVIALFLTAGCMATGKGWNDGNVRQINQGDTQQHITAVFGEPTTRTTSSDGTVTWTYRKSADSEGFSGKRLFSVLAAASTLGARSGENALVVDVLKIVFRDGRVVSHQFSENLDNNLGNAGQS